MAMQTIPTLQSERLVLRPFLLGDAAEVQRLAGDWAIADTTMNIPHPYEDGMAEKWISKHANAFVAGEGVTFAVTRKQDGALIGAISLMDIAKGHQAEVGYWIGRSYWNSGFCTEAARTVLRYAFTEMDLVRVYAYHLSRNPASGRVMQKLGMRHEGTLRQHARKWGKLEDLELYGILKKEWEVAMEQPVHAARGPRTRQARSTDRRWWTNRIDRRLEIAARAMGIFERLPDVIAVFPRGTLASRAMDEFSDIDIGIDVSGSDNAEFAKSIDARMRDEFDLYFSDWATSLMPHSYVQTFYVQGLPIFWNIDIEVTATPHHATLTPADIVRDPIAGFLKVWMLNTKYLLRQKQGIGEQIGAYFNRVFEDTPPKGVLPQSLLVTILAELQRRAKGQYGEFIAECHDIWDRYLKGNELPNCE